MKNTSKETPGAVLEYVVYKSISVLFYDNNVTFNVASSFTCRLLYTGVFDSPSVEASLRFAESATALFLTDSNIIQIVAGAVHG